MKKWLLGLMCMVLTSASFSTVNGSGSLKKLWTSGYNTDYEISSVHYTSNTVLAIYHNPGNDRLYLGKFSYCSGIKLNEDLSIMEPNILQKSIQAYENRLFYVANEEKSADFNLVCTDLNLNKLWSYDYKDDPDFKWTWIDLKDDILVVHTSSGVLVFELKTGKKLTKLDTSYLVNSINNNCVLTKSDKLAMIDPYTEKPLWTYDLPTSGVNCYGIRKGFVLLATKPTDDDQSTKAICLDTNTGKEVFSLEYKLQIVTMGISGDLLGIVYVNKDKDKQILDAFKIDSWSYYWTYTTRNLNYAIIFDNNAMYEWNFLCIDEGEMTKIDLVTGQLAKSLRFMTDERVLYYFFRRLRFQANRIINAYNISKEITCYIDESF